MGAQGGQHEAWVSAALFEEQVRNHPSGAWYECVVCLSAASFSPHCARMEACLQRVGKGKKYFSFAICGAMRIFTFYVTYFCRA